MRNLIIVSAILLSSFAAFAQTTFTTTKTLPSNVLRSTVALPSNVEVIRCKGSRAQVEITVTSNADYNILKALNKAGRYSINPQTLTLDNMEKFVFVNGQGVEESIAITIYLGTEITK